jgi:hypothetical protein
MHSDSGLCLTHSTLLMPLPTPYVFTLVRMYPRMSSFSSTCTTGRFQPVLVHQASCTLMTVHLTEQLANPAAECQPTLFDMCPRGALLRGRAGVNSLHERCPHVRDSWRVANAEALMDTSESETSTISASTVAAPRLAEPMPTSSVAQPSQCWK